MWIVIPLLTEKGLIPAARHARQLQKTNYKDEEGDEEEKYGFIQASWLALGVWVFLMIADKACRVGLSQEASIIMHVGTLCFRRKELQKNSLNTRK